MVEKQIGQKFENSRNNKANSPKGIQCTEYYADLFGILDGVFDPIPFLGHPLPTAAQGLRREIAMS